MLFEDIAGVSLDPIFPGVPDRRHYGSWRPRCPDLYGGEFRKPRRRIDVAPLENAMPLIQERKKLCPAREAFRSPKEKNSSRLQRVMKTSYNPVLQSAIEIDHQVAAGDHIQ